MAAWLEITKHRDKHGGKGYEFGNCVWSPNRDRDGKDKYRSLRLAQPGDTVYHFLREKWEKKEYFKLVGRSKVSNSYDEFTKRPPGSTDKTKRKSFYKIELAEFIEYAEPLEIPIFIQDYYSALLPLVKKRQLYFPFYYRAKKKEIWVVQGLYLAKCTEALEDLLECALNVRVRPQGHRKKDLSTEQREFIEGRRYQREAHFFHRNATLARKAKELFNFTCQCCEFQFPTKYGKLGDSYIECHHLRPFSERDENEWTPELRTKIEDVTVLCANCHRMIHRKKPALTVKQLKACLRNK